MPTMQRFASALGILWAHGALSGCAAPSDEPNSAQSTCGQGVELQDVQLYDGRFGLPRSFVKRHRRAVGLLRWRSDLALRYRELAGNVSGVGWCSGTLVAGDLFLTAAHCLEPDEHDDFELPREKGGLALRTPELAREFVVEFRYEVSADGVATPSRTVDVVRLEEFRYGGLDYAILRLDPSAGRLNGVARIAPGDTTPGARVAILQHPAGAPMKVGAGPIASVTASRLAYATIDTLGGSSGAGILDAATGKLVGIHTNGGCTPTGGANYGIPIGALIAVSPTLSALVDRSRDFVVGDWDNDAHADLAVFHEGCLYPDANHDDEPDIAARLCPAETGADEYFVGRWQIGRPTGLGWRRGGCLFLDTNPQYPLCFGDERDRFDVVVADWNGDGGSDLGIQRGACIDFDTNLDGAFDERGYCYGRGLEEDEYLVGNWDGTPHDSIAVRRGNSIAIDADRNGVTDQEREYGDGGNEDQYLTGDWNGDGRAKLAVRRRNICLMNHDAEDGVAEEGRQYRDFWSAP